jgi:hypothetical protein
MLIKVFFLIISYLRIKSYNVLNYKQLFNKAYHSHSQQLLGRLSNQLRAGWRHALKASSITDIFGR